MWFVRARASKYSLCFRVDDDVPSRGLQDGRHGHGPPEQGSRMKPIYAQDRSALRSESPPFAGFYRVSAPVTSPKVPQP